MVQQQHDAAGQHRLFSHQAMSLVDKYDGEDDALAWLETLETVAELYYWTEDICLRVARLCMKGPAQRWVHQRTFRDWEDFQRQFARRFGETRETAVARLSRCYQHHDESPEEFADRFLENAERAGRTEDGALVYQFLGRLRPELREEAVRKQPQSVAEAVEFCNYLLGAMADEFGYSSTAWISAAPEYSSTAGFPATPDLQNLAYSMKLYYMERQEEQDMEIRCLRHALQQSCQHPPAATQLDRAEACTIRSTKARTADWDSATDYSEDNDSITEPIMLNYIQPADMAPAVSVGRGFKRSKFAANDSHCCRPDERLMTNYLQPEHFDKCVAKSQPDSSNSTEEAIKQVCMQPAAQSCRFLETTEDGHGEPSEVTNQTTEPLNQEQTDTTQPITLGAMAILETCLPTDHMPASQPLEHSSLIMDNLMPPLAEEATQEKESMHILSMCPGTKYKCYNPMLNDGKGDYFRRLSDMSLRYNQPQDGKPLNEPVYWQSPTPVPSVPPLPWPPPCLMDFGQWLAISSGPT